MSTADRVQPLAGLVSPGAEALYLRLCVSGSTPLGAGPGEVDPYAATTVELLDLGLVFRSGNDDSLIRPVDQAVALRLLLEQRQDELISAQRRILDGWSRLTDLLPRDIGGSTPSDLEGIIPLADFDEVVTRAAELYPSAKRRMRGTETGEFPTKPTKERVRTPPQIALNAGARFQMIYQVSYLSTPAGAGIIEESLRRGEEVRLRPEVPLKMLHIDDSVALVSTDRSANSAFLVYSPAILAMLAEWFDLLWNDSATMASDGGNESTLTNDQRRVLELMSVDGDEAIARRLNMSITTVRRHVKVIYSALGVNSRFAAGVAAAKRGWI
ncbi:MAG: LuxR C-terminal-related transcriptional regulator [Pseudonocardiaceae bacterium]